MVSLGVPGINQLAWTESPYLQSPTGKVWFRPSPPAWDRSEAILQWANPGEGSSQRAGPCAKQDCKAVGGGAAGLTSILWHLARPLRLSSTLTAPLILNFATSAISAAGLAVGAVLCITGWIASIGESWHCQVSREGCKNCPRLRAPAQESSGPVRDRSIPQTKAPSSRLHDALTQSPSRKDPSCMGVHRRACSTPLTSGVLGCSSSALPSRGELEPFSSQCPGEVLFPEAHPAFCASFCSGPSQITRALEVCSQDDSALCTAA